MVVSVLIVHRHLAFGEALEASFDSDDRLTSAGVATSSRAAVQLAEQERPDVALLDLALAGAGALAARDLGVRVVAMTTDVSVASFHRALAVGAAGLVGTDAPISEMVEALILPSTRMTVGGTTLELLLASARGWLDLGHEAPARAPDVHLTRREHEVLQLMREGLDAKRIAGALHVSVHTARSHIKRLLAKLGAHSQLEAVAVANRLGLDGTDRAEE